ncbi:adenosine deaminase [Halalkalicoccus tibetensis]|uniref:Adenosine deaminase n=1 Tax=Halalkalicoccus tibetensis TaxID=175632 RepID=A0ABD5V1L1_9EURY
MSQATKIVVGTVAISAAVSLTLVAYYAFLI